MLLKAIGDFERIGDHAVNILESCEELHEKNIEFSEIAKRELDSLSAAVGEIVDMCYNAFAEQNTDIAASIEPLEEVIDGMKDYLRTQHIERLRLGGCGVEAGFIWNDLITNMERVSDHCSNIAGCTIDVRQRNMNIHESLRFVRNGNEQFKEKYQEYTKKYFDFAKMH